MSEWRPIKTAPMGQVVLLFVPQGGAGDFAHDDMIVTAGHYQGEWQVEGATVSKRDYDAWSVLWESKPTYWMPLPSAPIVSAKQD